ncbi:CDP-glycerol glycerophosphotransferase family protein [Jatrophihabitans endophyticus]|uniref:bifunctional glycosyltransferase/CDP-glycerol:glycerophosphate glycerophosphotransferase n=1 Tax=Jatrophihabitans endophyticus TaxID=1206085 RepID=UPI0019FCC188|nr:CDP-glycerol glycerophosphotransferase family protein [Jatrophihabitans endophyticus]MBE7186963.1 CDP-glycerol glycerophosphotransferase family protein [Jatrophihabitans endophyticus]
MATGDASATAPRFSVVSAVYNVGRYLDEFIESVENQSFGTDRLQIIMVDDGSTDDSLERLQAWQRRRPELVDVVTKPNGGLPTARNAGMPLVRGEWVTFTDPDDILERNFFRQVEAFLTKYPQTEMVATRRMVFSDSTGEELRHALDSHFVASTDKLRNLDHNPGHFHGHAASTFFRTELIERENLRFDERLVATFEDGHFCNVYLLRAPEPLVGYVSSAQYRYRRRDDGTSQLDRSWARPGRFTDVFEYGYLGLLREGAERFGRPPRWVQAMVIYELSWFFKTNEQTAAATAAQGETRELFHELMAQVCGLLDEDGIQTYTATTFSPVWREILRHGYRGEPWHTTFGVVNKADFRQNLVRLTYRFIGEMPDEEFFVGGRPATAVHQKVRDIRFFDRTVMHERIVWLQYGTVRALVGGEDLDLRFTEPPAPTYRLLGYNIARVFGGPGWAPPEAARLTVGERLVRRLAATRVVRAYFDHAWVLIDRVFNADDSAEHLFRYLRKHRPGVNAWFVIADGTTDHRRLRRAGGRRVLTHGSLKWKLAMLNCEHLISSHIDEVIVKPEAIMRLAPKPKWRVTFLQHGIMKDDLSTWLNRKNIDVFVTSTPAEYESVVADHTTYRYTAREVRLTGLPRFDRILEEGRKVPPDKRDYILVAPTWRDWLTVASRVDGLGRHEVRTGLKESEYAQEWAAVVNSPELRELAERSGLKVAVLLHPNLQGTGVLELPSYVTPLSFEGQNIQEHFARARVLITDYSSMFFNAAYIERPVVYFQFDRERVLQGGHLGRRGYFDYERDGFGPVTVTASEAIGAVIKAVENGPAPDPFYLERIRATFPDRDGRCCERVADAIAESSRSPRNPARRSLGDKAVGRARRKAGAVTRKALAAAGAGR